jgi:hypothetical protein
VLKNIFKMITSVNQKTNPQAGKPFILNTTHKFQYIVNTYVNPQKPSNCFSLPSTVTVIDFLDLGISRVRPVIVLIPNHKVGFFYGEIIVLNYIINLIKKGVMLSGYE